MSTTLLRGGGGGDGAASEAAPVAPPPEGIPPASRARKRRKREFAFVVAGYNTCGFFQKANKLMAALTMLYPDGCVRHEEKNFPTRDEYKAWLVQHKLQLVDDPRAQAHGSSPFVTLNGTFLGGCDDTIAFCRANFGAGSTNGDGMEEDDEEEEEEDVTHTPDGFDFQHPYDYDLVVIGGGSGGLACAKEVAGLGARVALLDYVKPSPQGAKWGLGGTCVNVGCIPKKLYHQAALLGEIMARDLPAFGWEMINDQEKQQQEEKDAKHRQHSWETLRENVQAHIRSLNFRSRVALRDARVTYLNQQGRFVDPHTLEVVDKEGGVGRVTGARFVVAVGARPRPLECPGGDLAISSDDVFSLERSPGKTCVVGADYEALECAGFLKALGVGREGGEADGVTVVVRSVLLRGKSFDRECVDKVEKHLGRHCGVRLMKGVVPAEVRREGGRLQVVFSNGESERFDTVLVARGRYPDLGALNTAGIGLSVDVQTGKLICKEEQTNIPHVYAVGDVIHGTPELTPVAIQAGRLLARRLFGGREGGRWGGEGMDYTAVGTTVFTPLEYACVGMSEEEAREGVGEEEVEVYASEFTPLEWAMVPGRMGVREGGKGGGREGFVKVITRKSDDRVLGLHFCGPHAGEVMQGYAVAMKGGRKGRRGSRGGLTHAQLVGTVGIHPTSAEEFTMLSVSKSSGATAKKGGC